MEMAGFRSIKPVKHILNEYSKLASQGFDCETYFQCMRRLNIFIAGRGNIPKVYNDLTLFEMDSNWRMDRLADDIIFALKDSPNMQITPYNMARISREFGKLGYKNTELIERWFDKIHAMHERSIGTAPITDYEKAKISLEQIMYGGHKGTKPRHYIFQGFLTNEEFAEHVKTL